MPLNTAALTPNVTGKEVLQPYISDQASFAAWKDEAFALWTAEWGALYEEGSEALKVLQVSYAPVVMGDGCSFDGGGAPPAFTPLASALQRIAQSCSAPQLEQAGH